MTEYEWPEELDIEHPEPATVRTQTEFAQVALQRIREHNQRHHRNLVEVERERINRLIAADDSERRGLYISIAVLVCLVVTIVWLAAWLLS